MYFYSRSRNESFIYKLYLFKSEKLALKYMRIHVCMCPKCINRDLKHGESFFFFRSVFEKPLSGKTRNALNMIITCCFS